MATACQRCLEAPLKTCYQNCRYPLDKPESERTALFHLTELGDERRIEIRNHLPQYFEVLDVVQVDNDTLSTIYAARKSAIELLRNSGANEQVVYHAPKGHLFDICQHVSVFATQRFDFTHIVLIGTGCSAFSARVFRAGHVHHDRCTESQRLQPTQGRSQCHSHHASMHCCSRES